MPAKMVKRISNITTERRGLPSSPAVFDHFTNFMGNVSEQRATRPTSWCGRGEWTTANASGRADTRGVGTAFGQDRIEYPKQLKGSTKITD